MKKRGRASVSAAPQYRASIKLTLTGSVRDASDEMQPGMKRPDKQIDQQTRNDTQRNHIAPNTSQYNDRLVIQSKVRYECDDRVSETANNTNPLKIGEKDQPGRRDRAYGQEDTEPVRIALSGKDPDQVPVDGAEDCADHTKCRDADTSSRRGFETPTIGDEQPLSALVRKPFTWRTAQVRR